MHCPINDHCTLVMVLSNTQSLFWIWASKLLLWRRFDFAFLGQKKKTEMGMVDFSFSSQKVWNLDVSISSRIMRFVCKISLSLLETRENIFGFLFSSRNWRKCLKFLHFFGKNSRSLLEPENRSRHFSFLFSKLEMWIPYFSFSSRFDFLASRQCLLWSIRSIWSVTTEAKISLKLYKVLTRNGQKRIKGFLQLDQEYFES